jgi:hypothetical protein
MNPHCMGETNHAPDGYFLTKGVCGVNFLLTARLGGQEEKAEKVKKFKIL